MDGYAFQANGGKSCLLLFLNAAVKSSDSGGGDRCFQDVITLIRYLVSVSKPRIALCGDSILLKRQVQVLIQVPNPSPEFQFPLLIRPGHLVS